MRVCAAVGKHLTLEQRKVIEQMERDGARAQEIACKIGVHIASVYRELKRGDLNGAYCAEESQRRYENELTLKGRKPLVVKNKKLQIFLCDKIQEGQSPKEIEKELKKRRDPELGVVSHQTIYSALVQGYIPGVYPGGGRSRAVTLREDGRIHLPQWFLREHGLEKGQRFQLIMEEDTVKLKVLKES